MCFVCRSYFNSAKLLYSYWFGKAWFLTERNFLLCYIITSTWGFTTVVIYVIKVSVGNIWGRDDV